MAETLIVKEVSDFIDGSVGTFVSYEGMRLLVVEPVEQPDDCEVTMLIMPMLLND